MANAGELGDFTFDTSFFENGLKRIGNAMMSLPKKAKQAANGMSKVFKSMGTGVKKIFSGLGKMFDSIRNKLTGMNDASRNVAKGVVSGMQNVALKAGIAALALKGIQGILKNMPEVGEAFGIAKDVFLKNLLYPLRQAVFPYLQKLLDWVRDNRKRFVQWGQTLANVFSVVMKSVGSLISTAKNLISSFSGFFENLFGTPINNIQELFNVLSFKASVVIIMLQSMFSKLLLKAGPVLDTLGKTINLLIESVSNFVSGFISGFSSIDKKAGIFKNMNKMFMAFNDLLKEIMPLLEPFGKIVGKVFGTVLVLAFQTLEKTLKGIVNLIKLIKGDISLKEFGGNIAADFSQIGQGLIGGEKEKRVDDAIIRPDGTIIRTHPDDTLIATKNSVMSDNSPSPAFKLSGNNQSKTITEENNNGKKIEVKIDFSGMQIQIIVQEATQQEAQNIGDRLVEIIRDKLARELEVIGV